MKSILDPSFKYVPAAETDLKKTFERVRWEQAKQLREEHVKAQAPHDAPHECVYGRSGFCSMCGQAEPMGAANE